MGISKYTSHCSWVDITTFCLLGGRWPTCPTLTTTTFVCVLGNFSHYLIYVDGKKTKCRILDSRKTDGVTAAVAAAARGFVVVVVVVVVVLVFLKYYMGKTC